MRGHGFRDTRKIAGSTDTMDDVMNEVYRAKYAGTLDASTGEFNLDGLAYEAAVTEFSNTELYTTDEKDAALKAAKAMCKKNLETVTFTNKAGTATEKGAAYSITTELDAEGYVKAIVANAKVAVLKLRADK